MKIRFTIFAAILCSFIQIAGQAPAKFNYQAVARNTAGNLIINQNISVRVSILTGSVSGTSEYQETHSVTTDGFGVFNILVGGGTVVSGTFAGITWGSASKFLKIEADVTGGTTYQAIATTQILSAPYALYANESGTKTFNDSEFSIIYAGGIADNPPTAPNAVLGGMGAGSIDNGTHDYKVTFVTSAGETGAGPASASVTVTNNTADGKILISGIPVSSKTNVTSRNLYRRFNGTGDYKMVISIANNTTTTYIDNIANSSLGKVLPTSNGTSNNVKFDASGLTSSQTLKIPNKSGTIVLDEISNVTVQTKADRSLVVHGKSIIQNLKNGVFDFGANAGEYGEAFINAKGRNTSINIANTNAYSNQNNDYECFNDLTSTYTTENPSGFSNPSAAFDKDLSTSVTGSTESTANPFTASWFLGKTFSNIYVQKVFVKASANSYDNVVCCGVTSATISLQYFNGTTWNDLAVLNSVSTGYNSTATFNGECNVNNTIQGIRIKIDLYGSYNPSTKYFSASISELSIASIASSYQLIESLIPTGTFSSTIKSCVLITQANKWETGNDIQYQLSNGSENSGWLKQNEVSSFSAFTSEPTKVIIKLIPKTVTPTPGYPSIFGFYLTEF